MNPKNVGTFIANLRREENITQKELAERIGVTDKAVSRWETGKGYPDIECLQKISETLGITINELLCGEKLDTRDLITASDKNITEALHKNKKLSFRLKSAVCVILALCLVVGGLGLNHYFATRDLLRETDISLYNTTTDAVIGELGAIIRAHNAEIEIMDFDIEFSKNLEISTVVFEGIARDRKSKISGAMGCEQGVLNGGLIETRISASEAAITPVHTLYLKDIQQMMKVFDITLFDSDYEDPKDTEGNIMIGSLEFKKYKDYKLGDFKEEFDSLSLNDDFEKIFFNDKIILLTDSMLLNGEFACFTVATGK